MNHQPDAVQPPTSIRTRSPRVSWADQMASFWRPATRYAFRRYMVGGLTAGAVKS
jgi:hypothetical protein